jgi:ubiquinone/menaquinone biosynthesis C-methylase UbiE
MQKENDVKKYVQFFSTTLGKKILERETRFVSEKLIGCRKVLSIGCGPALLEARLQRLHPDMTIVGLDTSKEMITQAPKGISVMYGDAQHLEFQDNNFDAVLYITSLEFIENIQKAIQETFRVLKAKGLLLVLMLNTNSQYFQEKYGSNTSYIRKNIKHTNINRIQQVISQYFIITNKQYFLGVLEQDIVDTDNQRIASLYILQGERLC